MALPKAKKESTKSTKSEILNFNLPRKYIFAESEKGVLIIINLPDETINFWVAKKFVFPSEYTLNARIGLLSDQEYDIYVGDKLKYQATGKDIFEELPKSYLLAKDREE